LIKILHGKPPFQLKDCYKYVPFAGFAKKRNGKVERFEIPIRAFAYSQTGRYRNHILTDAFGNQ
jgi:hypothetical protein